uniref:Transmembrane protein n=1 Tax=Cacopsylla melanoneura TaxID=428564 RepID=A0A8D8Q521_9HEMI
MFLSVIPGVSSVFPLFSWVFINFPFIFRQYFALVPSAVLSYLGMFPASLISRYRFQNACILSPILLCRSVLFLLYVLRTSVVLFLLSSLFLFQMALTRSRCLRAQSGSAQYFFICSRNRCSLPDPLVSRSLFQNCLIPCCIRTFRSVSPSAFARFQKVRILSRIRSIRSVLPESFSRSQ